MHNSSKLVASAGIHLLLLVSLAGCSRGTSPAGATANVNGTTQSGDSGTTPAPQNKETSDPLHPVVVLETTLGKVTLTLDAEKAPVTVKNFLSYVNSSFYDQTVVHQVIRDRGVVAGGYDANLAEKHAHMAIRNEAHNGLKNVRGNVAMARLPDVIDSATSQFFINLADNPSLDFRERTADSYGYCVFGKVSEGMDVVDKMGAVEVHNARDLEHTPAKPIIITSARQIH
jgi:cyclophilin family peptidyl-prolyl cis-trans isomerase